MVEAAGNETDVMGSYSFEFVEISFTKSAHQSLNQKSNVLGVSNSTLLINSESSNVFLDEIGLAMRDEDLALLIYDTLFEHGLENYEKRHRTLLAC